MRSASTTAPSFERPSTAARARWPRALGRRRSRSERAGVRTLPGTVAETAYIGVATQVVVRTAAGTVQVFAQNMDAGGRVPRPGSNVVLSWAPESTFIVDRDGMLEEEETHEPATDPTRAPATQCGRWRAARVSVPARRLRRWGGGGSAGGELNDVLNFSNWELYIDTRARSADDAPAVHGEDGHQGQLLRGRQLQPRVLREGAGAAGAGQRHRSRHLRLDRQRSRSSASTSRKNGCRSSTRT